MKTLLSILAFGLLQIPVHAEDVTKSLVTVSAKKQLLDSNHEMRGKQGDTSDKTFTLHVEITNTTSSIITGAELTGNVLVTRSTDTAEKLLKEPLVKSPVPPLKPNKKVTIDLGMITLHEKEWKNRKFEEKLEEWKVVCVQKQIPIGSAVSGDHYATLEKTAVPPSADKKPANKKKNRKPLK